MLNVHHMKSTEKPGVFVGTMKQLMPFALALVARGAREDHVVGGRVQAGVEALLAVDHPVVAVAARPSSRARSRRCRGSGSVSPKATRVLPVNMPSRNSRLLLLAAEALPHHDRREVADDRRLVLQVVVQAEALRGEVLADDRHRQVRAVAAAVLRRERVAQEAGRVGAPAHLAEQLLPVLARHAAVLEVGARVLAAVVEEADVVVLLLERLDLAPR